MYSYRSEKRAGSYSVTVMFASQDLISGLSRAASRVAVRHHPYLGLKGATRDWLELYQEHIINLHEALTNRPLPVGGLVHSVRALWFGLSNTGGTISPQRELTAIESK